MTSTAAQTARTYALIGFIFYLMATIAGIIGSLIVALLTIATVIRDNMPYPGMMPYYGVPFFIFPLLSLGFVIGIAFTGWAWYTFKHIETGKYSEAKTYSLILGILGLFFAWLFGGIFFLLAYSKLGEIQVQSTTQAPTPSAAMQKFCINCGNPMPSDAKFCSKCGKEQPTQ